MADETQEVVTWERVAGRNGPDIHRAAVKIGGSLVGWLVAVSAEGGVAFVPAPAPTAELTFPREAIVEPHAD
jgi:hypothetical protein